MSKREEGLIALEVGDIFHAESINGVSLICLVYAVTSQTIEARTVTTQLSIEFDRKRGTAEIGSDRTPCKIDSVAMLPDDVYCVMMAFDTKFRGPMPMERSPLSEKERKALLFVDSFYKANALED